MESALVGFERHVFVCRPPGLLVAASAIASVYDQPTQPPFFLSAEQHCSTALCIAVPPMPIPGLPFSDEQLWNLLNGVLPAWLLLAVAPRWRHTIPIVTLTAAFYSLLYVGAMAGSISGELLTVHPVRGLVAAKTAFTCTQQWEQQGSTSGNAAVQRLVGLSAALQLRCAAPLTAGHDPQTILHTQTRDRKSA